MTQDTKTPGQWAYEAYYHTWLRQRHRRVMLTWTALSAEDRHAWEAAAQAVLAQCVPPQEPLRRWTPQPLHKEEDALQEEPR